MVLRQRNFFYFATTYYAVLTYYVDGIRKMKWVSTGFKENETKKKWFKKNKIS